VDTIKNVLATWNLNLSDKDWLLSLVQETMAVPLSAHCPVKVACQQAALARNSFVDTLYGVTLYSGGVDHIAFEPLAHIGHTSDNAAFYLCETRQSLKWANIWGNGAERLESAMGHSTYTHLAIEADKCESSHSWTKIEMSCPEDYQLKHEGEWNNGEVPVEIWFVCTTNGWYIGWGCLHGDCSRPGNFQPMEPENLQCVLKEAVSPKEVRANQNPDMAVDTFTYTTWSLGGSNWTGTFNRTEETLSTLAEALSTEAPTVAQSH